MLPRIPARPRYNHEENEASKRTPVAQSPQQNYSSHKTKVTITTQTPNGVPDQIIYPLPYVPSSPQVLAHPRSSGSETASQASESVCSAQTQKTGTTATTATFVLIKDAIEFYKNGQYDSAMKSLNTVLKSQMLRRAEDDSPLLANILANIGLVHLRQDRYELAIESLENAVRIMRHWKMKNKNNIDEQRVPTIVPLAGVLNNLGTAKFLQGDIQASLKYYWEAIRDAMKNDGLLIKKELANSFYNIGRISVLKKDFSMASNALNEAIRLEKKLHGEKSTEIIDTLNLIGFVHYSTGAFDRAVSSFTEALSIVTERFGSVHEKVAISLINVGTVLEKEGDLNEALRCFSTAQDVCKKVGLDEKNATMHTAIKSMYDIRRKLSMIEESKPFHHKQGRRDPEESLLRQTRKTSRLSARSTLDNRDHSFDNGGERKSNTGSSRYRERRAITEYREDPFWEFDDSSMVEEDRDDIFAAC